MMRSLHFMPKRRPQADGNITQDYWFREEYTAKVNLDDSLFVFIIYTKLEENINVNGVDLLSDFMVILQIQPYCLFTV